MNEIIGLYYHEAIYVADEYKNTTRNIDVYNTELFEIIDDYVNKRVDYFYNKELEINIPF